MRVNAIHYDEAFKVQFLKLPQMIQKRAVRAEALFRDNPFYPSLRLHKLGGKLKELWSLSIDRKYRILFKPMQDGMILLVSIGLHAIYEEN